MPYNLFIILISMLISFLGTKLYYDVNPKLDIKIIKEKEYVSIQKECDLLGKTFKESETVNKEVELSENIKLKSKVDLLNIQLEESQKEVKRISGLLNTQVKDLVNYEITKIIPNLCQTYCQTPQERLKNMRENNEE